MPIENETHTDLGVPYPPDVATGLARVLQFIGVQPLTAEAKAQLLYQEKAIAVLLRNTAGNPESESAHWLLSTYQSRIQDILRVDDALRVGAMARRIQRQGNG